MGEVGKSFQRGRTVCFNVPWVKKEKQESVFIFIEKKKLKSLEVKQTRRVYFSFTGCGAS
jgi:hypothetical protein